jgi:hypothetical protein
MKQKLIELSEKTSQSKAVSTPVWKTLVKEGQSLPNSETEDVGGFSLCPAYSAKQLHTIQRLRFRDSEKNGTYDLITTLQSGGRLQW